MTNRFIFQHLLDNSIFASTFSPEPILGIIGQSGKSSDLVSDQKRCYIAPVLTRGWLDTSVYLARPSWFHLGQSADGVLPTLEFPTLTDLTTFLFNFELWASHWLGGRQTQRGRQTCTAQYMTFNFKKCAPSACMLIAEMLLREQCPLESRFLFNRGPYTTGLCAQSYGSHQGLKVGGSVSIGSRSIMRWHVWDGG